MKKKQVNEILITQAKRRNKILSFTCIIILVSFLSLAMFLIYINRNKTQYVNYDETSKIDYQVYIKENDFFEGDFLDSKQRYIASLIKKITANFNYNLSLDENVEYKYSYEVDANIEVKEKKTSELLYNKSINLLHSNEQTTTNQELQITEDIDIDYNYYNNLIKKFVNLYDLENVESVLNVNLYVNIISTCKEKENKEKQSVVTLSIPLTTNTVAIDISNNLINSRKNILKCESNYKNNFIFIILGIVFIIADVVLVIYIVKYSIKSRTAENIYERELKKILNNYGSYIQNLVNDFKFEEYQILKVNTFNDILEIRDTIRQPILMKENDDKTGAYFIIPSSTKVLYVYRLKVKDIKKEIRKK